MYPENLKYTKEHEWIDLDSKKVGITYYAQEALGDVVFVELPEVGMELEAGDSFGVVESVKAVSDIYAPVNGRIIEVNEALIENPELINQDPYGEGWIIKMEITGGEENLLSVEDYQSLIEEE